MSSAFAAKAFPRNTDVPAFFAIVLAAFVLRLAFVIPVRPLPVSDFAWYFERAQGLVHGLGYTLHGLPTALWPPGWPYFLAGIIRVFGPSVLAAETVQALLNALTAGAVFAIGRTLFGRPVAIAAGVTYALLPSAVEWCATLASEPLYTLLWAMVTYIWVARRPERVGWFALSGAILGAAALVRPSALLYWLVPLAYALLARAERPHLRAWLGAIAVAVACMALVVCPMIVRNYRAFGTLVVISNNGGVSLYEGNNPQSGGSDSELHNPQIQKLLDDPRTEVQGDRLASQIAVRYMLGHPREELILALKKIESLYKSDDSVIRFTLRSRSYREAQSPPPSDRLAFALVVVNTVFYYAEMVLAFIGFAVCLAPAQRKDGRWRLLAGMIVYNTAIFAVITGIERYRYPTMPFFCVFAGLGLASAWSYMHSRSGLRAAALKPTTNR